jgi:hypothetical protein
MNRIYNTTLLREMGKREALYPELTTEGERSDHVRSHELQYIYIGSTIYSRSKRLRKIMMSFAHDDIGQSPQKQRKIVLLCDNKVSQF